MSEILRVLLFSFLIPIVILVIIGVLDNMKESNKAKKMFQKFENDFRIEGDLISLKINAKKTRMFLLKTSKKNLQKELNTIDEKIIKIDGIIKETIKFNLRNAEKQAKEQNFSVAINIIDEQKKYIDVLEDKHFANKIKFVKKRINDAILDINSKEIMNKLELVDGLLKSSKFKEALILLDLCQKKANEFKFEDLQPKITGKITLVNSYKKLT